jgi:hypothetical protein
VQKKWNSKKVNLDQLQRETKPKSPGWLWKNKRKQPEPLTPPLDANYNDEEKENLKTITLSLLADRIQTLSTNTNTVLTKLENFEVLLQNALHPQVFGSPKPKRNKTEHKVQFEDDPLMEEVDLNDEEE